MANRIENLFEYLLEKHGPQGWWPIIASKKNGHEFFYHKADFSYPKNDTQRFEVCVGAILAQNTSWKNAEKALLNLYISGKLNPNAIIVCPFLELSGMITSSGYYRQKSKKLVIFSKFYLSLSGSIPKRDDLLNLWGIGPETADSILLYAYNQPEFVVDAYTVRILKQIGLIFENSGYEKIKNLFENSLPKRHEIFSEYHALIVREGKNI